MDRYDEYVVKAKPQVTGPIGIIGGVILALLGLFTFLTLSSAGIILLAGGVALCVFSKESMDLEYEYIFTNGDIDVAKVIAKKRRKNILSIESSSIAKMDRGDSDRVKNDMSLGKLRIKEFLGKEDPNPIAFYVGEGDNQYMLLLDLNDTCIEHMKAILKSKSEIR
ncbi:MAG: hypothetical protein IKS48_14080 [Eubacterium sp.]|nr:hypothetical protein [Eubacterium sp.]